MAAKPYPLTIPEQMELQKFLEENLAKGYIRELKSLLAACYAEVTLRIKGLRC